MDSLSRDTIERSPCHTTLQAVSRLVHFSTKSQTQTYFWLEADLHLVCFCQLRIPDIWHIEGYRQHALPFISRDFIVVTAAPTFVYTLYQLTMTSEINWVRWQRGHVAVEHHEYRNALVSMHCKLRAEQRAGSAIRWWSRFRLRGIWQSSRATTWSESIVPFLLVAIEQCCWHSS